MRKKVVMWSLVLLSFIVFVAYMIVVTICCGACVQAQEPTAVWYDSTGLIVELKEKYGGTMVDTCTVLMIRDDVYYTTHRDGTGGTYPMANYSARIVRIK